MPQKRIYLAGPMQGIEDFNFLAFYKYAKYLRTLGYEVFSPAERDEELYGKLKSETGDLADIKPTGFALRKALSDDTQFICNEADGIAMMPGWENSKGAFAEWSLARALGLEIIYL